jgi:hypothetical protein
MTQKGSTTDRNYGADVDRRWAEFMQTMKLWCMEAGIPVDVSLEWMLTQIADGNYHWARGLGREYVKKEARPPRMTFAEIVQIQIARRGESH